MSPKGSLSLALGVLSCGEPAPLVDPFVAGETVVLESPGRSLAVIQDGARTVALVAREFESDVIAYEFEGGVWSELFTQSVGQGPRSLCVEGSLVVVASTSAASIDLFSFDGIGLVSSGSVALEGPPAHVACGDLDGDGASDVAAIVGLDKESSVVVLRGPSFDPAEASSFAIESAEVAGVSDVDGDGDLDVVVLATARSSIAILENEDGALSLGPSVELPCESPRAFASFDGEAGRSLAVACNGAIVSVSDVFSEAPAIVSFPAPQQLYDILAGDFDEDGRDDWVTVDITEHQLVVWLAAGTDAMTRFDHAVARGPIDMERADGDLVVLSIEERRLSLFVDEAF